MRSPARLHRSDLPGLFNVGDIEDSHAAETVLLGYRYRTLFFCSCNWSRLRRLRRKSLSTAIQASIGHLHRHEQQILVHGNIALAAGTHECGQQGGHRWMGDVVDVNPVEVPLKQMLALK